MKPTLPTKDEMHRALCERHGNELQAKISASGAAVCGLGGLGSNICISLARAGIGKLCLIDFDRVDLSNLNRQQYEARQIGMKKAEAMKENLSKIAPYVKTEAYSVKISPENITELLSGYDIIIEAFDKAEEKAMLVNFVLENFPEKYIISSSGMAGLSDANSIKTRKITKKFFLCGDGKSDSDVCGGLFSSRVAVCAAHAANAALRIIAGYEE